MNYSPLEQFEIKKILIYHLYVKYPVFDVSITNGSITLLLILISYGLFSFIRLVYFVFVNFWQFCSLVNSFKLIKFIINSYFNNYRLIYCLIPPIWDYPIEISGNGFFYNWTVILNLWNCFYLLIFFFFFFSFYF